MPEITMNLYIAQVLENRKTNASNFTLDQENRLLLDLIPKMNSSE